MELELISEESLWIIHKNAKTERIRAKERERKLKRAELKLNILYGVGAVFYLVSSMILAGIFGM